MDLVLCFSDTIAIYNKLNNSAEYVAFDTHTMKVKG